MKTTMFVFVSTLLMLKSAYGQGYHDVILDPLVSVLNSTGAMGPSTTLTLQNPYPPQNRYTHHLGMFQDPTKYSDHESYVVGIAAICIVYNFSTTEEELSMYVSDFANALVGNLSAVYLDDHELNKSSERRDYAVYLPPPMSAVGLSFIHSMRQAGYSALFPSPTSYPKSLAASVVVTSDVLTEIQTMKGKTFEALGIASYAEALEADVPCMKIRIPQVDDLDNVHSPRLKASYIDSYKVDLVNSMVGLTSPLQDAYPLVGALIVHAPALPPCNESRHSAQHILKYLLLDDAVPHSFSFAGFLVINTIDGNAVMSRAMEALCMPIDEIPSGGSRTIHSIMTAWVRSYTEATSSSFLTYPGGGSDVGINMTLNKEIVFGATDDVLTDAHYTKMPSIQMVPLVASAVSIVVNLGDDISLRVPRCAIVPLLNGTITIWNHSWLKKSNPDILLPHSPVRVIVWDDDSNTADILRNGLEELDKECNGGRVTQRWPYYHEHVIKPNATDSVQSLLHHNKHTITYLPTHVARSGGYDEIELLNEKNNFVSSTSKDSIVRRLATATVDSSRLQVNFTPSSNSYPFVGITYIAYDTSGWSNCKLYAEGLQFLRWTLTNQLALTLTASYNYFALPSHVVALAESAIIQRSTCNGNYVFPQASPSTDGVNLGLVIGIVIGVLALLVIPVGWKMTENHRRVSALMNNDRVATELAESISSMRLEDVEYLNSIPNPTRIQSAFIKIIQTLKEYRSYLPASLLNHNPSEEDNDGKDDNTSLVPSSSRGTPMTSSSRGSSHKGGSSNNVTAMIMTKKKITFGIYNVRDWHAMRLNPSNIADFHTRYIQTVRDAVTQSKGTPDVFLGDRFLATWNTTRALGSHRTACLNSYFAAVSELQKTTIVVTHGASSGEAVCGNMGCDGMKKYTYIGMCSSLAPTLERLNRTYETKCLIDISMEEEATNNFELCLVDIINVARLGVMDLKVFEVVQPKVHSEDEWMYQIEKSSDTEGDDSKSSHVHHSVAVVLYHNGKYGDALRQLSKIIPNGERCLRTEKLRHRVHYAMEHNGVPQSIEVL